MDVKDYFQSYEDYFWEWTTDEDIPDVSRYNENNLISIPNVGAIAYRPYVMEILKELKDQGFPPFGSLLLVLYAIQDGYLNLDGVFFYLNRQKNVSPEIALDIEHTIKFLENLSQLGSSFKKGQNKIILLRTIFGDCHNKVSAINSGLILKIFDTKPHIIAEAANKKDLTPVAISRDIKTLALLQHKFPTRESIINAMKGFIDIPELEDEVVKEETNVETDKDFIQELIEEPKTFQIGSLIKRIWSGLKIPMRHLSPGEQPIGGISDMTNKSDFNRMLLSEFANEDEVFMNRVANNEALYIQREIPPEENIFERIILIDTSIKNWGTPKVLAFASAIAVIKHPKANSECKVFALGQTNIPISLDKVDEVVENLNQVSPVLEVSYALEKFFNEEYTEKDLEVFFITHQENLVNPNLQKVIHENRDRLKFLVTTSSDGELNFYKHHKGTRKHIQKIVLPLQELWVNPPQRRQKRENNSSKNWKRTDVPMNYPILFPTPVNKIATFLYEGEFYILSNKKQLLRTYLSDNYYNKNYYDHYKIHRGCEVLFEDISVKPKGQFALAKNRQQQFILCQYHPDKRVISKLNLNTKEYSELYLAGYEISYHYKLIYFDKEFYLHHKYISHNYRINIDGNISLEKAFDGDGNIDKNTPKVEAELYKLENNGIKILNNFSNIGINAEKNLVISNNELNKLHDDSLTLYRNRHQIKIFANQNKNRFTFSDGSEVITDSRGMLTFKSSNKNIPEFYIPSTEYGFLALATHTEFGGSEYYLPQSTLLKMKKMEDMYAECLKRFIDQIWEYGA
ncbi:hypothetical protein IX39_04875 [Chryseobacterium formosense]|uniref:Uncharacterized protein n=1 Tax=Chryseobacterium formosense TaxID=236814 RepID=A0A085Z6B7_9FLAO|nr:hypothetical protein [Chryseobacterium formosense]KFE99980.1 hypothetical protein IX39_04875 [Chryseobacterium formosense]SFT60880.1 hypothetical protein SAMN05421857_2058 [Chryseobacterium formosense]